MHHYTRFLGAVFIAGLLSACSGGGGTGGAIPTTDAQPPGYTGDVSPPQTSSPTSNLSTQSTTSTITYQGTISGIGTGGEFILSTTGSAGHIPVFTNSGTRFDSSRAPYKAGEFAIVAGSGTTSHFSATVVTLYTSVAQSIGSSPVPSQTTTPVQTVTGVQKHVLTGDYFSTPWGTTSVSPAAARPYLDWVRTESANGNTLHAAGFKVQIYTNPNRVQSSDPMYTSTATTGFAKTCGSSRVYDVYAGINQYVTVPGSIALKSSYGALIAEQLTMGHIDAIFEDNAGPLEDFGVKFMASMPCSYNDSAWISGEVASEDALPVPTIINGLSAFHNHSVSQSIDIVRESSRNMGGEVEHCFSDNSRGEQGSWPWTATEDTQLQVTALHKLFQCQAVNSNSASSQIEARIYTLASFEMTYNPSYSVLWELFATPSGLHVMPESQFVALEPAQSVTSIAQLHQSGGSYVRIYNACYYAGRLIGKCAMAVNPDYYAHSVSLSGFHHTLTLSGNGILDGGSVGFSGAAPASTLAPTSAIIAVP